MTLADLRRRRAVRLHRRGNCCLGFGSLEFGSLEFGSLEFGSLPALGATASISPALSLPLFPHFRFLAMILAVTFVPPSASSLAALRTAISGLGVSWSKWFFASLE